MILWKKLDFEKESEFLEFSWIKLLKSLHCARQLEEAKMKLVSWKNVSFDQFHANRIGFLEFSNKISKKTFVSKETFVSWKNVSFDQFHANRIGFLEFSNKISKKTFDFQNLEISTWRKFNGIMVYLCLHYVLLEFLHLATPYKRVKNEKKNRQ